MLIVSDSQIRGMADSMPNTPIVQPCLTDQTWIEFCLVDSDNNPAPGERYNVRLPDQSLMTGTLDKNGKVRFDAIVAGQASICFPDIDKNEWSPLSDAAPASGGSAASGNGDSSTP
jgi:hypothetical protein